MLYSLDINKLTDTLIEGKSTEMIKHNSSARLSCKQNLIIKRDYQDLKVSLNEHFS